MQNKETKPLPLNKDTKILLLNTGMKSKELKYEKIKKRKKKRAKAVQWLWREGLKEAEGKEKELKEEKEEECTAQVLNGDRERERESHLLKDFFCSATARLLQLCGGVWERQSFRFFNFFCRVQDYK